MTSTSDLDRQNEKNYRGLMVSIRAGQGRLNLLIAVCDDPDYRQEIIDRYQKQLAPQVRSYGVELDRDEPSLRAAVASIVEKDEYLQNGGKAVVTVTGAEALLFLNRDEGQRSQQEIFLGYLQWTREALRQFPFTIVLWLTNQLERKVRERARDFWSWRKGVFRFQCHRQHAVSREDMAPFASFLGREFTDTDDDDPHFLPVADLQELIEKIERQKGVEDSRLATLYQRLGMVYQRRVDRGEYEDYRQEQERAIECFEKAIKLQRKFDKEIDLTDSLNNLAGLYRRQNRLTEAEPLLLEAIDIDRKALPKDHPQLANHLSNLASLYRRQNRLAEAEPLLLEAIDIVRKALPKDHPDLAAHLNNLAGLYYSQNRLAEAERLYLEAIDIVRKALPKDHPQLANHLNNLALLYKSQNRLAEAERLYLEAIDIVRKALPKDHPLGKESSGWAGP